MHIIRLPQYRPDIELQWGGNRAKLWCYKQFGYQGPRWEMYNDHPNLIFVFEQEQDAVFFSLRWGG